MKYILILLAVFLRFSDVFAQEKHSPYLFPEFTDSYIYYKDGRVFLVPVNYDLFDNIFVFIDKNNEKKEFADPEKIVSIKAGTRTFIPIYGKKVAEVIQTEPRILVRYTGNKRIKKDLTFGGKTETASVDSYSNLIYGTGENEKNTVLVKIDFQFYVEINKRLKQFSTEKQFLKLFSKHKVQLKKYIDGHKIDFETIGEVRELCNYALSLN